MTWGASLIRLPKCIALSEIAEKYGDDWKLPPVGSVMDVRDALHSLFPDAEHVDGQTVFDEGYAHVQFNYEDRTGSETVESIGIVSNGDEDSIAVMKMVCDRLDLRMVDHQFGEVADFETEPQRSMKEYRAFCDRAREQKQRGE